MNQLAEHLRFFQELGATGVSRNPAWRRRAQGESRGAADARREAAGEIPRPSTSRAEAVGGHRQAPSGPHRAGEVRDLTAGQDSARAGAPIPFPMPATEAAPGGEAAPVPLVRSVVEVLTEIRADLGECTRCKLHTLGRQQIVFGTGSATAEIMFVGEAPGADEDAQGVPFVGRAGQLLTKMIEAMGLTRDEVYIANVLKCRPPGNRNPEPDEIQTCQPFLFRQIASIEPKVVIALGAFAARTLLETADPISKLRGRVFDFRGGKLVPTFHPSFLLRSPGYKREAWEDLKTALGVLGRKAPAAVPAAPTE